MSDYDLLVLQPNEFENLTRDLLQKKEGVFIESFTIGRDGGVDLRFALPKGKGKVIVQAKRYKNYAKLKSVLSGEAKKVALLKPERYILSTSVGLTPANKTEIQQLFKPYIKATEDILGRDDLNNLLGQYPEVEKQYYKLWLASTTVLESILNKKIENWSALELEETRRDVSLYVMNDSFDRASKILRENRYVIISGIPGIGKTTLARMLMYNILSNGYEEFVKINSMDDAAQKLTPGKKQIFFYDDFLGSSYLDIKEAGFESKILSFIEKVKREPDKLFILSTREYILAAAKREFEKFSLNNIELAKCTLDLSNYSEEIRATILYNHLADADLPIEYVKALLVGKRYLKLIRHDNFNPRIIEAFLKERLYLKETPEGFVKRFLDFFDRPYSVWEFAFSKMKVIEQQALLVRATMGASVVFTADWFDAVKFYMNGVTGAGQAEALDEEWNDVIKDLLGTFIITSPNRGNETVGFHNPSVYDFLIDYIRQRETVQGKLIRNALFANQITGAFTDKGLDKPGYGRIHIGDELAESVVSAFNRQKEAPKSSKLDGNDWHWYKEHFNQLKYLNEMLMFFPVLFRNRPELLKDVVTQEMFVDADYLLEERMSLLDKVDEELYGLDLNAMVDDILPELERGYDYVNTASLMERSERGQQLLEDDEFISTLEKTLNQELEEAGDDEECESVKEDVHELAKYYSGIDIDVWDKAIEEAKRKFEEPEPDYDDWDPGEGFSGGTGKSSDYYDLYSSLL